MKRTAGFTLVEALVTLVILALLAVLVLPSFSSVVGNARARSMVQQLTQDFTWARAQALSAQSTVTLTWNSDCTWTTSVNGSTDAAHSMTLANFTAAANGLGCVAASGTVLPVTFTFDATGRSNANATVTYSMTGGQSWVVQALPSGTMLLSSGAQ